MKQNTYHVTRNTYHDQGFTLIELVIVVFILVMITAISITNYMIGEKRKRVVIAQETVINAIRNAQNFTLTGKETNNPNANCRIPREYRITFSYAAPPTLSALNNCGNIDIIETYPLPLNTRIRSDGMLVWLTSGGAASAANSSLSIAFSPPFAALKVSINGSPTYNSFNRAQIIVESNDRTVLKSTWVDGVAGRIGD